MLLTTPIAVVTAVDELSRDLMLSSLTTGEHNCVCLRHSIDFERGTLRRVISDYTGIIEDDTIDLAHACSSCAMREDAIPTLQRLVDLRRWDAVIYALPLGTDPMAIATGLGGEPGYPCAVRGAYLGQVVTVHQAHTLVDNLLGEALLDELDLSSPDDGRTLGEAVSAQLEYSDAIVLDGTDDAALELLGHLVWDSSVTILTDPFALSACDVFDAAHDGAAAIKRRDPEYVQPGSGWRSNAEKGALWTLNLTSERPFHPERLVEKCEELGAGRLRARGHFWVPTRPSALCQWEGAGGAVAIGSVGDTGADGSPEATGPAPFESPATSDDGLPTTHLVITGDVPEERERIAAAFEAILLTDAEWEAGLWHWLGVDDGMDQWLGVRGAGRAAA